MEKDMPGCQPTCIRNDCVVRMVLPALTGGNPWPAITEELKLPLELVELVLVNDASAYRRSLS